MHINLLAVVILLTHSTDSGSSENAKNKFKSARTGEREGETTVPYHSDNAHTFHIYQYVFTTGSLSCSSYPLSKNQDQVHFVAPKSWEQAK